MPAFEDFECANCGETFRALDGANAADGPYCSPQCETEGKDLH